MIALNGAPLDFAALCAFSARIAPPNRDWKSR